MASGSSKKLADQGPGKNQQPTDQSEERSVATAIGWAIVSFVSVFLAMMIGWKLFNWIPKDEMSQGIAGGFYLLFAALPVSFVAAVIAFAIGLPRR